MKQYLHLIDYSFWAMIIGLQCLVAFVAIRRGLARTLPRYLNFVTFVSLKSICLLLVAQLFPYRVYFWSFYAGIAAETVLLLLVLYEIFANTFNPRESLPANTIARLATIGAAIVTVCLAYALWTPASRPNFPKYVDLLNTLDRSASIVVACSLWSLVMYARWLGIPWRSRVAGIARGFLLNLSVQAFAITAIGFASPALGMWFSRVGMAGYVAALGLWLRAVLQREVVAVLPAPEKLKALRTVVAQMRIEARTLQVRSKTRLREE
jgi:hypothetical protein